MSGTITSLGYEGWSSVEQMATALASEGVALVVDVRLNAVSRKRGFSKNTLAAALAEQEVSYRNERALGNPKENRAAFHRREEPAWARYRDLLAEPDAVEAQARLLDDLAGGAHVAVLCMERDASICHRTLVVEAVQQHMAGVEVRHLEAPQPDQR